MKIIHCSDVHLDSAMNTYLTPAKAQERKKELFETFVKMVEYARKRSVRVILIAGDLFDTQNISRAVKEEFIAVIKEYAEIDFLYLCGNHDEELLINELKDINNVKLFPGVGKAYRYGDIVITGLNRMDMPEKLKLKAEDINIVMLHGQLENINKYAGKYIDYIALGHIHKYSSKRLDERGEYCYCGCLEPRGFDECGEKGFVLIETGAEHMVRTQFVPFSKRKACEVYADVSGLVTAPELYNEIKMQAGGQVKEQDMLRVCLTGARADGAEWNLEHIKTELEKQYYIVDIKDETKSGDKTDCTDFEAHFIRLVQESGEDDLRKQEIITCGLNALRGRL